MQPTNQVSRYSEADLQEFKALIDKKVLKTENELKYLEEQIAETSESIESEGDWMDDTSNTSDLEMLNTMAARQRKHLSDLRNALQRIHNKSYGICVVTSELIDKKRLLAVPTTTKSMAAKMQTDAPPAKKAEETIKPIAKKPATPKIITKVIRKSNPAAPKPIIDEDLDDEDYDDLDLGIGDDDDDDNEFDFENENKRIDPADLADTLGDGSDDF